jgi:threonine dehydrogenase-like Zn-dependent dehydrogenase
LQELEKRVITNIFNNIKLKNESMAKLPQRQHAIQLVGPDELVFNNHKKVTAPGPHQILCRVEAVGLCFSDLKLLKQFSSHVRKGNVISGIEQSVLNEIPSYVPAETPTVPGHEAVVEVASVGPEVQNFKKGEHYLVQADYRWLKTKSSNSAFGYNFEGALQEYVLMDERVITSPEGESMLLPISSGLSASAAALVEPWACVEYAYASKERRCLKADGQMLVVADVQVNRYALGNLLARYGRPKQQITWISKSTVPAKLNLPVKQTTDISKLNDASFDDVVYFGSNAETVETLSGKVAEKGLLNIVLCGGRFAREVAIQVGRVHYGGIRIGGTSGCDPAESMEHIPKNGEIRPGDKANVIGAGGPMGVMHIIRNICSGIENISVFASDIDDERLETLTKITEPLAKKNNARYKYYNPTKEKLSETFDYTILMAPVPELVASAVHSSAENGIINIFAGIAEMVNSQIDLNTYIDKKLYLIGASGSTINEMKAVLKKVESGRLNTDVSVAAVCGLEGAIAGIRAVENRRVAGKIIVYPACKGLGLIKSKRLGEKLPQVAKKLDEGFWNKEAEKTLLKIYQNL